VSEAASAAVLVAFAVFCRVGACIMLMPGFSSARIPARARLFVAIALSLAAMPLLYDELHKLLADQSLSRLVSIMVNESLIGIVIGLAARLFFLMLEMLTAMIAQSIGLAGIAGMPVEEGAGEPTLVTFVVIAATLLFFLSDLHLEVIRGLISSYDVVPPGAGFPTRFSMAELADALTGASLLALRLSGPFIVLSVLVNFAFGLANKMTPMIQIYFAAMPVLIGLGFLLMMVLARPFLQGFIVGLHDFLVR
jgi:flagellar biosynthetic protein FliR